MTEPAWTAYGRTLNGTREVKGRVHNPRIMAMVKRADKYLGIKVIDDETAWCGTYMADCMIAAGIKPPPIAVRAKSWASWGVDAGMQSTRPPLGAVAVFQRPGGGHVGQVVGVHDNGDLSILGGNQGDAVNIRRFPRDRLIALRWPAGVAMGGAAGWADASVAKTTGEA